MAGNSDFIEQTMELSNDGRNLRRQVAGIHGEQAQQVALNSASLCNKVQMYGWEVSNVDGGAASVASSGY
jgi:hypothetical protein